jgi:hypothetical protein
MERQTGVRKRLSVSIVCINGAARVWQTRLFNLQAAAGGQCTCSSGWPFEFRAEFYAMQPTDAPERWSYEMSRLPRGYCASSLYIHTALRSTGFGIATARA